ncbi:polymer-forming cytoskeletal protein [Paenibacillus sp. MWE-103]|uniref:Polymer-forming cytoskeletal protein n=1 Tax=Paenibacillus artemisiicola TaxID=1172618 RepID=A0ABS3WI03_9BACL|nr:polymer-forming cytoskeletal protein [Paenibacillus artemisiicola]MBO7747961.1 polymer-forming cytoskeletal protein [Paenibacillus artemisiicola]
MFKFWKKDRISTLLSDTFIGEGTIVEGAIRSAGSVRLEGQLRGDLFCEGDAALGETAFAISNITARSLHLAGQVTGNVRVSGKLTITATGKLVGDMDAATLEIEEGGVFQGKSAMDMGEPVVSPVERRGGRDRRVAADPNWNGEERRSGYDRRNREDRAGMPRKFSFRAPERAVAPENAAPAEAGPEAAASGAAEAADPLRESGRAFMQSMNGGGARAMARAAGVSEAERAALGVPGQAAAGKRGGGAVGDGGARAFDAARGAGGCAAAWGVLGHAPVSGADAAAEATFGPATGGRSAGGVSIDELLIDELGGESAEATFVAGRAFAHADEPRRDLAERADMEDGMMGAEVAAGVEAIGADSEEAVAAASVTVAAGVAMAAGSDSEAEEATEAASVSDAAEASAPAIDAATLGMTAVACADSKAMSARVILSGLAAEVDDAEDARLLAETQITALGEAAVRRGGEATENIHTALQVAATEENIEHDISSRDAGVGGTTEDAGTVVRIAATSRANIVETAEAPDWPVFEPRRPARRAAVPAAAPAVGNTASRRDEEAAALLRNW